jgi:hypothetical protein
MEPKRCPACGTLLGARVLCPACASAAMEDGELRAQQKSVAASVNSVAGAAKPAVQIQVVPVPAAGRPGGRRDSRAGLSVWGKVALFAGVGLVAAAAVIVPVLLKDSGKTQGADGGPELAGTQPAASHGAPARGARATEAAGSEDPKEAAARWASYLGGGEANAPRYGSAPPPDESAPTETAARNDSWMSGDLSESFLPPEGEEEPEEAESPTALPIAPIAQAPVAPVADAPAPAESSAPPVVRKPEPPAEKPAGETPEGEAPSKGNEVPPKGEKAPPKDDGKDGGPVEGDANRTYEAVRRRDMLTTDFILRHPNGDQAQGITAEEEKQIEETIRGACYALLATQDAEGALDTDSTYGKGFPFGTHAMAMLTLLNGGIKPSTNAIKAGIKAMLKLQNGPRTGDGSSRRKELNTYEVGIGLMAYHALAVARRAEKEPGNGQQNAGKKPAKKVPDSDADPRAEARKLHALLTSAEEAAARELREILVKRCGGGRWSYYTGGGDNSNCHYAILGLLAAFRVGLDAPPPSIIEASRKAWVEAQGTEGPEVTLQFEMPERGSGSRTAEKRVPRTVATTARGWGYMGRFREDSAYLSMSAAGVLCLTALRYMEAGGKKSILGSAGSRDYEDAIYGGLAWLGKTLGPGSQAAGGEYTGLAGWGSGYPSNGYTMLAVERGAIFTGCNFLGTCEWYPKGARALVTRHSGYAPFAALVDGKQQQPSGKKDAKDLVPVVGVYDCMDILFLKSFLHSTPKQGPEITGKGRDKSGGSSSGKKADEKKEEPKSGGGGAAGDGAGGQGDQPPPRKGPATPVGPPTRVLEGLPEFGAVGRDEEAQAGGSGF